MNNKWDELGAIQHEGLEIAMRVLKAATGDDEAVELNIRASGEYQCNPYMWACIFLQGIIGGSLKHPDLASADDFRAHFLSLDMASYESLLNLTLLQLEIAEEQEN